MKQLWLKTKRLWNPPQKPLHKVHDCRKAGCILGADGPVHGVAVLAKRDELVLEMDEFLRQQNPAEGEKRGELVSDSLDPFEIDGL